MDCSETFRTLQALSVSIRKRTLDGAARNIARLNTAIETVKRTDTQRLQNEYQRLLSGLRQQGALPGADHEGATAGNPLPAGNDWLANPQVPNDILQEAVSTPRPLSFPMHTRMTLT
jgi:DNA excision repair protein ERCC-2